MHYSSKHGVEAYSGRSVKSHQLLYCPVCTRHSNAQFTLPIITGVNHRGRGECRETIGQNLESRHFVSTNDLVHVGVKKCSTAWWHQFLLIFLRTNVIFCTKTSLISYGVNICIIDCQCNWVQFLTGRRPLRSFSAALRKSAPMLERTQCRQEARLPFTDLSIHVNTFLTFLLFLSRFLSTSCPARFCRVSKLKAPGCLHYTAVKCIALSQFTNVIH